MLEIIHKIVKLAQKVDCHADKSARNDKNVVDCHTLPCGKSRNDRKNATFKKVDSRGEVPLEKHDSKHCGGAVAVLRGFWGRSYLDR